MKITVGSRESKLAVVQSNLVIDAIIRSNPGTEVELLTMKTTGDIILDRTLDKIGGKGLFVKELEQALSDRRVDLVVHSYKDVPMIVNPEIPITAVSQREDPRDVLILPEGKTQLDPEKPIGCSSQRRTLQLKELYPNAKIQPIRGNVQTRLKKLDSGEYSALVLAYAGIKRLGLEHRVSRVFETTEMLPAACQGILAIQTRKDFDKRILSAFHCKEAEIIANCERSFVRTLNGGCSAPVAAYAEIINDKIHLTGFYMNEKGLIFKNNIEGSPEDGEMLGKELAQAML